MAKRNKKANSGKRFRKVSKSALLVLSALLIGGGLWAWMGGRTVVPDYQDPVVIGAGGNLYAKNCAVCHGVNAQGENPQQRMGGEKPPNSYWAPALNGSAHAWHHPPTMLFNIVKKGSPVENSPMRGWKGQMSDGEIHSVLAYMQSLWPDPIRLRYRQMHRTGQ